MNEDEAAEQRTLVFEMGGEFEPDAPWGSDRVQLTSTGRVVCENRDHGHALLVSGSIPPERAVRLFHLLDEVGFPNMPDHRLPPGGGIARLALIDRRGDRSRYFNCYVLETLPGYDEVITSCMAIARALRTDDRHGLSGWGFVGDRRERQLS